MDSAATIRFLQIFCLTCATFLLAGCGARADHNYKPELIVFAAASLTDVFEELGEKFEHRNPGAEVRFNFAGSSVLLTQLRQGAPADVFASADELKMEAAVREGLVSGTQVFARNSVVVITSKSNPEGINTLRDLAGPDLDLVLAQQGVPIAEYAQEILREAGARYGEDFEARVIKNVVSREADVRAAANRVALGEADATFVYASYVTPEVRDSVEVVEIPEEINIVARYPIAVTEDARTPELAEKWVELLLSDEGQHVLEKGGFRRAG